MESFPAISTPDSPINDLSPSPSPSPDPPPPQPRVLVKFFLYSAAMFTLPFIAFFVTKHYCEQEYDLKPPKSYIYPTISAVAVVQIIIFSYIYEAIKEDSESKKNIKKTDWNVKLYKNTTYTAFIQGKVISIFIQYMREYNVEICMIWI